MHNPPAGEKVSAKQTDEGSAHFPSPVLGGGGAEQSEAEGVFYFLHSKYTNQWTEIHRSSPLVVC